MAAKNENNWRPPNKTAENEIKKNAAYFDRRFAEAKMKLIDGRQKDPLKRPLKMKIIGSRQFHFYFGVGRQFHF